MRLNSFVWVVSLVLGLCDGGVFDDPVTITDNCLYDVHKLMKPKGGLDCHRSNLQVSNVIASQRDRCSPGSNVTLSAKVDLTFHSELRDFGWYVSTDGGSAMRGKCFSRAMTSPLFLNAFVQDKMNGEVVGKVDWLPDASRGYADRCGDIVMEKGGGGILRNVLLFNNLEVACSESNANLDIDVCFTWNTKADDEFCDPGLLHPGGPFMCHCERLQINEISVEEDLEESMKQ